MKDDNSAVVEEEDAVVVVVVVVAVVVVAAGATEKAPIFLCFFLVSGSCIRGMLSSIRSSIY